MHERFVLEQLMLVVFGKTRSRTQTDARRPRRGFGDQVRIDLDRDFMMVEKRADPLLQFVAQHIGGNAVVGIAAAGFVIELVGQLDEMARGVDIADRAARQTIAGATEQANRMLA